MDEKELDMVLYAVAKMIYLDKQENKEEWEKLFFNLVTKVRNKEYNKVNK